MKAQRLLFVATLYLMAAVTFVVFVGNVVPWCQFRFSARPATLALQPDPVMHGPDDERRLDARQRTLGHAVQLKLDSGETLASHAHLTTEQRTQASNAPGLRVLFRKDGSDKVRVIGGLQELDAPWPWLALGIVFSLAASYARKLYLREKR